MRRSGVITRRRQRRERGKRIRRRAMLAGGVLLICSLAMAPDLRDRLGMLASRGAQAVHTLAGTQEEIIEITLPRLTVYAAQLGVYDSGERAASEQKRLMAQGIPCIIWQGEKMRIVCAVAASRETVNLRAAGGQEAYILTDTAQQVNLHVRCAASEEKTVADLIRLPDTLLGELLSGEERTLAQMTEQMRMQAKTALADHPEHLLYTQLAQSLINWCDLTDAADGVEAQRDYAAVMMYTICREWRSALLSAYEASAASTASAQRTPSTAADVMPPA